MRPCQLAGCERAVGANYPNAEICRSDREMVLVVEDDDDLRETLVELVEALGFPAIGCPTVDELQRQVGEFKTGCVLLDVKMPGRDGIAAQEWLNQAGILLPVVFLSGIQDLGTAVHCMKAGAVEFLQKPFSEMALRQAVTSAVGLSRQRHCQYETENMVQTMVDLLTPTELVVAQLISRGFSTKLIAAELGRSENTIKIHRHRVFNKMMVNSAASLANIFRIVDTDDKD
ncbi:MAG: hypothetical protein RLZZ08_1682 [Pseudomonadota bacterium]|jgi:FixJ family two-component response regulator